MRFSRLKEIEQLALIDRLTTHHDPPHAAESLNPKQEIMIRR